MTDWERDCERDANLNNPYNSTYKTTEEQNHNEIPLTNVAKWIKTAVRYD